MKQIEQAYIARSFHCLQSAGILKVDRPSNDLGIPTLDEEYLTICNAFVFNIYNLGMEQAIIHAEQKPDDPATLEGKRAKFTKAILKFIADATVHKTMLSFWRAQSVREQGKTKFEISRAVEYLKLVMQIGIVPKSNKNK